MPTKRKPKRQPQCVQLKRDGKRCTNRAKKGSKVCSSHSKGSAVGAPTKFTDEVRTEIVNSLLIGCSRTDSARCAGISPRTLEAWLAEAKREEGAGVVDSPGLAFLREIRESEAKYKRRLILTITDAARAGDWKAALAMLERKDPAGFAKLERIQHDHTGHVDIEHLLGGRQPTDVPPEIRERIVALLEEGTPEVIDGVVAGQ